MYAGPRVQVADSATSYQEVGLVAMTSAPDKVPISQANSQSRLLSLPAELRNKIFIYALGHRFIQIAPASLVNNKALEYYS
ncbi:hypothetical protein EK21DRAFT_115774 [Setomelanomma holmii]|uniref:F-box domain-containing protein n=1 Tax=Setomelanomma holmii TaxID=210430 RepID=A0A9P4H1G8_9PLEO|nr:hypothetical protein EK21DRAFT_115774 [Setomelanomma holmii]